MKTLALIVCLAACHKQAGGPAPAAPSGTVEARLKTLEEKLARYGEALDFLAKVFEQQKAQDEAEARSEPAPDAVFAVQIAEDVKLGLVEGPPSAPVTIVKAFDFACPHCARMNETMHELVADYGGRVRVVFKNFVVHHDTALAAHLASCGAAKQGKYIAFKNAFWDKAFDAYVKSEGRDSASLGKDNILVIAKGLGLDTKRLAKDMEGPECKALIANDMKELEKFKVTGTPAFFINGQFVGGAIPKHAFKQIVDEKLKIAEGSGVAGADYYDLEILGKGEQKFRSKLDPKPN